MSLLAVSLGDRFCFSRMGGIEGGGWVHQKGANSMAMSWLSCRNDLVGNGRAISVLFGINGVKNKRSHLIGPLFPAFILSYSRLTFLLNLNWKFVNWWVWLESHICHE